MGNLGERFHCAVQASVCGAVYASLSESYIISTYQIVYGQLTDITQHSFCFRWLTKEPNPKVVFIDLRETLSVGPVISLLDRVINQVAPYWEGSVLKNISDRVVTLSQRAAQTHAGQLLRQMLIPPKSPKSTERDDS